MKHRAYLTLAAVLAVLSVTLLSGAWQNSAPRQAQAASTDIVPLVAGCNNESLTSNTGTPLATVAAGITPAPALESIWRYFAAEERYRGWSPLPGAPNDFNAVTQRPEPVFICMRNAGQLDRPTI